MREHKPLSSRFWLLILAALMALSLLGIFLLPRLITPKGNLVGLYLDGERINTIDLAAVTSPYTFSVTGKSGLTATVEVEPGRIRVKEATCPDQICVERGWLEADGPPIVCLPNTLVLQIENPSDDALDAVVGG